MVETSSEDHLMLLLIWYFEQLAFLEVRPHCIVDLLEHGGFDDEFSADPAKMGVASRGCTLTERVSNVWSADEAME